MTNKVASKGSSKFKNKKRLFFLLTTGAALLLLGFFLFQGRSNSSTVISADDVNFQNIIKSNDFKTFRDLTEKLGPENSYVLLKKQFPNNETQAHDFAHVIGIVAYDQKGIENLKICDTLYNYGCYHGFIESFVAKNGSAKVTGIEEGCIALGPVHAPSCLHGIGHGVMVDASYNLEKALGSCSILKASSQIYCWDGVFMERITGSMQDPKNRPDLFFGDNLNSPCDSLDQNYKNSCFRNQVGAWFRYFASDIKKVGQQCLNVESTYQNTCFESLGNHVAMLNPESQNQVLDYCTVGLGVWDICLVGAMDELMFEGKSPDFARSLCQFTSPQFQQECFGRWERLFADFRKRFPSGT